MLRLDFLLLTLPLSNRIDYGQKSTQRSSLGSSRRCQRDDVDGALDVAPILSTGHNPQNHRLNQRQGDRRGEMMMSGC
jgi:hypothetical protein